jgi:hypothetical protein
MNEVIELAIELKDGVADCRIEPASDEEGDYFTVTILYPELVNGYSRSEIFCHDLFYDPETNTWFLDNGETGIHPKIRQLERQISDEINRNLEQG